MEFDVSSISAEDLEKIQQACKKISQTYNQLSDDFIKFSLAFNELRVALEPYKVEEPTLFEERSPLVCTCGAVEVGPLAQHLVPCPFANNLRRT